jgi:hypothetical protein
MDNGTTRRWWLKLIGFNDRLWKKLEVWQEWCWSHDDGHPSFFRWRQNFGPRDSLTGWRKRRKRKRFWAAERSSSSVANCRIALSKLEFFFSDSDSNISVAKPGWHSPKESFAEKTLEQQQGTANRRAGPTGAACSRARAPRQRDQKCFECTTKNVPRMSKCWAPSRKKLLHGIIISFNVKYSTKYLCSPKIQSVFMNVWD